MKVAIVNACYEQQKQMTKINAQHIWYDHEAGWLIAVKGGRLEFMYDTTRGRNVIKVADLIKTTVRNGNNYEQIIQWFNQNKNEFDLEIVEAGSGVVAFSFEDGIQQDLEDALYFNRFDYEIL